MKVRLETVPSFLSEPGPKPLHGPAHQIQKKYRVRPKASKASSVNLNKVKCEKATPVLLLPEPGPKPLRGPLHQMLSMHGGTRPQ